MTQQFRSFSDLLVNGAPLGWHFDGTYTDKDVILRITISRDHDRHTTVILETLDGSVSVYIQRNINDNFTFLGVYVGAVDGFSPQTQGIIGEYWIHYLKHLSKVCMDMLK